MLICPSVMLYYVMLCYLHLFQYGYVAGTSFRFETLFCTQPFILVIEEIYQNKSVVQTPITYFINQKQKHVSIRHNSVLTLMKSGAPFSRIHIMYVIYLDVKYFSIVCHSIYYKQPTVKITLTTMGHFFAKKLNYCPSDIICIELH